VLLLLLRVRDFECDKEYKGPGKVVSSLLHSMGSISSEKDSEGSFGETGVLRKCNKCVTF
jgi:hypothetical protein